MSRFVPAGTVAESDSQQPDDAWVKAQQQVEAQKRPKASEEGKQDGGKSLYEVLQQNKAAKQEAFEESIRLKNQFRPLDDDEVDFLDSVLESDRAKENAVKQETAEQLEAFRKQRALAEQALLDQQTSDQVGNKADLPVSKTAWITQKKKRRRDKETESEGNSKSRKLSATSEDKVYAKEPLKPAGPDQLDATPEAEKSPSVSPTNPLKAGPVGLGLGDYSSDEDE